jgi:hypothetical protein
MKKIDILGFITDFRKSPNAIKTYPELIAHFGEANDATLKQLLEELKQTRVLREADSNGQKTFQVIGR